MSFEYFIGRRYLRAKQKERFIRGLAIGEEVNRGGCHLSVVTEDARFITGMKLLEALRNPFFGFKVSGPAPRALAGLVGVVHAAADLSESIASRAVVVHLAAQNRLVAGGVHNARQRRIVSGGEPAAVVPGPDARGIFARGERKARRNAQRRVAVAALEGQAPPGQSVEVGCPDDIVAVTAEHAGVVLVGHDNDDVRLWAVVGTLR